MSAPLSNPSSLEKTGFRLNDAGFFYNGSQYRYEELVTTFRVRQRFEMQYVGVGSDYTHSVGIYFEMLSGQKVKLIEQPTWTSEGKPENVDKLEEIYRNVSEKTFQTRIQRYIDQVNARGFFVYDDWTFHTVNRTITEPNGGRVHNLDDVTLFKKYGVIEVRRRNEGIAAKLGRAIGHKTVINTLQNTDVFFSLLAIYYAIEWKT